MTMKRPHGGACVVNKTQEESLRERPLHKRSSPLGSNISMYTIQGAQLHDGGNVETWRVLCASVSEPLYNRITSTFISKQIERQLAVQLVQRYESNRTVPMRDGTLTPKHVEERFSAMLML